MTNVAAPIDFNPTIGMVLDGPPPSDPETEPWRVIMAIAPGFAGPPVHIHPHQDESFEVLSGVLDIFLDGKWRQLRAGESLTVPRGRPHALRNLHDEETRAVNVHSPALGFPRFMAQLHELVRAGTVRALPPKDPRSVIHLAMLFTEHERTMVSVRPPQRVMRLLASIGRRFGCKLPAGM